MQKIDLKNTPLPRLFFTYFIPSFFTMLALSTYSTVDGIFIGRKLGSDALAAIAIIWPIFPILIAFELLLSLGGSTLASYYLGRNKAKKARAVFSSVFYFAVLLSLPCSLIGYFFAENIASFFGASALLKPYATEYLRIIALGFIFIILHPLSDFFVVNDKQPLLATISMIVGAVSNIILNYYFIFILEWGISGSAWATILAHCIGFFMLFQHFIRQKGELYFMRLMSLKIILSSIKIGLPQSFAEVSTAIVMLLFNLFLIKISGERGVAIYSLVMYCGIIYFSILFSISQAVQPIVSYSYGAGLLDRTKGIYFFAFKVALILSLGIYLIFFFMNDLLVGLFLKTTQNDINFVDDVRRAIRIYYLGFIFLGINILSAIFLQSIQRTRSSLIITFCYTIGFLAIFLPLLSKFLREIGIWISYPVAQFLAFIVALFVLKYENTKNFGINDER